MPVIPIVIPIKILVLALGIVRKPMVWVFMISKYPGMDDIGIHDISYKLSAEQLAVDQGPQLQAGSHQLQCPGIIVLTAR